MDEQETIQRTLGGDVNAFEALVSRYHVGLIIHCERMVGDRQTAEDIAQEAFVKAFTQLSQFDAQKGRFSTWLYVIATRKALDYLRANKRVVPDESVEELADDAPDYASEEQNRIVRDAVARLKPPEQKRVIEAYYWEGKSYQAIADELDIPINTVRTWLHRAKAQLRSSLS